MDWISVKDRLPEIVLDEKAETSESKEVLVRLVNDEVYKAKCAHWFEDDFLPENFSFYYTDSGEYIDSTVTHWMYYERPND